MPPAITWSTPWVPSLGIDLAWRLDGFSLLFIVLIAGIGAAVVAYTAGYMKGHPQLGRLYLLLGLFALSMLGAVLADDLILLFVFWELTSILSFFLVGFNSSEAGARAAARTALFVTGGGGMVMLAGFLLLINIAGTSRISALGAIGPTLPATPGLATALLLVAIGAFTKSAQVPFHFWLPGAMAAPAPVSAYLHSATMVKLGVYLLARLDPAFGAWPAWQVLLAGVGAGTALWAMVLALQERDLKRILAWSTVSALGTMVMLVGLPGQYALLGLVAFILSHALYKAPLFFVAGNVEKATGRRIIDDLGGLRRGMPLTALTALLAGIGMAGLPLSLGYVAKAAIKDAKIEATGFAFVQQVSLVVSAVAVAVAGVAAIRIFWRRAGEDAPHREKGVLLLAPPLAVALTGLVLGVMPHLAEPLLAVAAKAIRPATITKVYETLDAYAGGGAVSLTLVLGLIIFAGWDRIHSALAGPRVALERFAIGALFDRGLTAFPALAARLTRTVQGGRLVTYTHVLLAALTLALWSLLAWSGVPHVPSGGWPDAAVSVALLFSALGAILAAVLRHRAVQLLATGVFAFGSAVFMLFVGAPDLALTQLAVETVLVIVAAALLLRLWRRGRLEGVPEPLFRPGAAVIALAFGSAMAAMLLVATSPAFDPALGEYYLRQSVPAAYGRNVVNVILVDFRAVDTLGEAAVVVFGLLAAYPVLRALMRRREKA